MIKTKNITRYGLLTAVIAVFSMVKIPLPFTLVPITLQTLAIMIVGYLLGWREAGFPVLGYIFLGVIGFPISSGFSSGFAHLFGPTGGFIFGFLPSIVIFSFLSNSSFLEKQEGVKEYIMVFMASIIFHLTLYFFGISWYILSTGLEFRAAFNLVVAPFILFDIIKILIFTTLFRKLRVLKS